MRTALAMFVFVCCWSSLTQAQSPPRCFGGDTVASVPMTLGARIEVDSSCEYARSPDGPFRRLQSAPRVGELLQQLGWGPGDSTTVYARPRATSDSSASELTSVFVDHCTDYLLAPGGAFRVSPGAQRGELVVDRRSSRCGAAALALSFECSASNGPEAVSLSIRQTRQQLPVCSSGWQVSAVPDAGRGYSLGRLRAGGETPLQAFFAASDPRSLMTPSFDGEHGFRFAPDQDDTLWEELRAAFASGAARVVRKPGAASRSACEEGEPVEMRVTSEGVMFTDETLAAEQAAELGADGMRMVSGLERLKTLAGELHVCLAASYGVREAGAAVLGMPMRQLAQVDAIGAEFAGREVCIEHATVRVNPSGLAPVEGSESQCAPATETALFATVVGSTLVAPEGAIVCQGREPVEGTEGRYVLPRGLVDVRVASNGGCRSLQTASLARVGVIDPGADWLPVGLGRATRGTDAADVPAWAGVQVDNPVTFARVRREDTLRFRINTPEGFASAWNHPARGAGTAVSRFAPVVGNEQGAFGQARPPAFSVRVSKSRECPLGSDEALVHADDVLVDQRIVAHLVIDDGRSARCVASAAFRAWEPRVLTNLGRSVRRQLRLGLLGDARLGVFFSGPEPGAIGALLPILYLDLHLKAGFLLEISIPITAAVAWEDGGASRISPAVMAAMNWGVPNIAPRLLTFGFMVHAPWPHPDDEVWSFFGGINLSSLFDLMGGR